VDSLALHVLDETQWTTTLAGLANVIPDHTYDVIADAKQWKTIADRTASQTIAYVTPRGVGPTQWSAEPKKRTQIRRRFMQLGQTAAGMQTYDIFRSMNALQDFFKNPELAFSLEANKEGSSWALFASLFIDNVKSLTLNDLSPRNRDAPDLLNISRIAEPPHVAMIHAARGRALLIRNGAQWNQQWSALLADNPLAEQAVKLQTTPANSK
jgi:hypothetical protein